MTTHTVQAQTQAGLSMFDETSDVQTKHELIGDAIDQLIAVGGLIRHSANGSQWNIYKVEPGQDVAIQDNEQKWINL